ncbi:MAG: tRNA-dihydrouridine synthase family protein, partial [Chitinispirillaceae bacterium]|nr:tRNA-dihydrouridine synthase family protein [Chitinispirillaceae bacterium]
MNRITESLTLRDRTVSPPLLCAPMAGITHSAFRRLVAGFGGYGALCTEMLSTRAVCSENNDVSPFTKKRACEGGVVYQLRATEPEEIPRAVIKLKNLQPFAIDINLGCPAPEVKRRGGGIELFDDRERLARVLGRARASWDGPLTVKCRL